VKRTRSTSLGYDTLSLEGALLLPDVLEKAAQGKASLQTADDYHVPKGFTPQEEYGRAFRIAQAQWKLFSSTLDREDLDVVATTRGFVEEFLRDALGYSDLHRIEPIVVGERRFPIDALAVNVLPVVIAPHDIDLDDPATRFAPEGGGARKKSAFQLAQEFLNASPDCDWGLVTNGRRLRLLRDATTLTRPSFIEFNLETILAEARYPDFAALWRLLHASRAGKRGETVWETWRADGQREGSRVREGLRIGVTAALQRLGEGFIQHPGNETLRRALISGDLSKKDYFEQLLRLVYRCIFLFAVEERELLHPRDASPQAAAARQTYREGYSAARLRERCLRRLARDAHDDLWQALVIVFCALAAGEPRLALPALGGLFAGDQCPNLDTVGLSNRVLLDAIKHLRWSSASGSLAPVDYRNMGPEELGSVYESLLELVPDPDPHARTFGFVGADGEGGTQGNARKTSGSYYTPDSLVQELIKSALDPVIEARIAAQPDRPIDALLSISVVDPACGSGHFLLAAARRLAERLAALRAPEGAVRAQDYRHALREVITHCVYGVDRNPMALELARFALWLEGFEEGRPLGFLDHHLVCGDALIGITDVAQLGHGVPEAAFKPLSGDDKAICKAIAKENKEGLKAFAKRKADPNLQLGLERESLLAERAALEVMPDETLEQSAAKKNAYDDYRKHEGASRLKQAADLFVSAFLAPKAESDAIDTTPTSRNLYLALYTDKRPDELPEVQQVGRLARAEALVEGARVLHWPLKFVQVFARGGFDCVLGNPPWERIKLQEEEFFANENRLVAEAKNKAERAQRIDWLSQGMLARHLYPDLEHRPDEGAKEKEVYVRFIAARRLAEAASVFAHLDAHEGGRYPLTGVGDVNTYALFAETIQQVTGPKGRAGFIVPTGIATDDSTKAFFAYIAQSGKLVELLAFENEEFIFPSVHHSFRFCLLVLAGGASSQAAKFVFFARQPVNVHEEERQFELSPEDYRLINPNTLTCPVFRSRKDAELTRKIYARVPVLIREARDGEPEVNPWGLRFSTMFHMSNDSHLFADHSAPDRLPLYEAKMIHQFDHRWATYRSEVGADVTEDVPLADKQNPAYTVRPRYWVEAREVYLRTASLPKEFLIALRERNVPVIVLAIARMLLARWLDKHAQSAEQAIQQLFPAWRAFVECFPFARALAPTQLGLCGDNPPALKPLGAEYLPAVPIDEIVASARESTAWYAADPSAVAVLMASVADFPSSLEVPEHLSDEADVLAFAERCLERATPMWFTGFRDVTSAHVLRTVIASALPRTGAGNNLPLMMLDQRIGARRMAGLLGNLSAMVLDFVGRHKVGGNHLNFFIAKQLPVLPPDSYAESDFNYIVPRVLELTYTANDLTAWATDLGFRGPPFPFDANRRARLRAELDAYYARLYGLSREDLGYVLDPASVMGADYPSETFRVLRNNEEREFGEYRTQRLVLAAWDALERGELT